MQKKFVQKMKNYTFLKSPWPCHFKICKIFCKILNNLIFNQEKLKMCKFPLTGCLQKICNFFRKTCAIRFLMSKASKKLNFIKIWQVEVGQNKDLVCYRKKQSFRQCAWGLRQLVLKGVGGQSVPPSRIRVNKTLLFTAWMWTILILL